MSFEVDEASIVKRGRWQVGATSVRVVVVQSTVRRGSGDYADDLEIHDDREGIFFDVWYGSAGTPDDLQNGVLGFAQLAEAVRHVEGFGSVVWES